ncbi:MAG: DUF6033 family protein [Eubacterium sp.]|nr:DUF6033 family protein [Eubacterium sp.]
MSNVSAISAYQQMNQNWKTNKATQKESPKQTTRAQPGASEQVKTQEWKPIDTSSSLVPTTKEGYGLTIGEVNLSDKAKEYYKELQGKFSNAQFILVSKDMMNQVKANASAYGNADKMVVLIDEEKLERMANDESYRKKYEGIISMAQTQLASAKDSLASTGANVKNFGITVDKDGTLKYFATLEKSSAAQAKRIEKKQEEKRSERAKEAKETREEFLEERLEGNKEDRVDGMEEEYVTFTAHDFEHLFDKISAYAYENLANNVMTQEELSRGQNIDFAG